MPKRPTAGPGSGRRKRRRPGRKRSKGQTRALAELASLGELADDATYSAKPPFRFITWDFKSKEVVAEAETRRELLAVGVPRKKIDQAARALEGAAVRYRSSLPAALPKMTRAAVKRHLAEIGTEVETLATLLEQPNAREAVNMAAIAAEMQTTATGKGESVSQMPAGFPADPTAWIIDRLRTWIRTATTPATEPRHGEPPFATAADLSARRDRMALRQFAAYVAAIFEQATGTVASVSRAYETSDTTRDPTVWKALSPGAAGPTVRLIVHALGRVAGDLPANEAANLARNVIETWCEPKPKRQKPRKSQLAN